MNNDISKTGTDNKKESNMYSRPHTEKDHVTITNPMADPFSDRVPRTVLDHATHAVPSYGADGVDMPFGYLGDFALFPGGQLVVASGIWNGLLRIEFIGVPENTVQRVALIDGLERGRWDGGVVDLSLWRFEFDGVDFLAHEISYTDCTHRGTYSLGHRLLPGDWADEGFVVPGTRFLCLETSNTSGPKRRVEQKTRIIDIDSGQVVAEWGGVCSSRLIPGTHPAKIFCYDYGRDGRVVNADGSLVVALDLPKGKTISPLALGPKGEGYQTVTGGYYSDEPKAELMLFDAGGKVAARMPLPEGEMAEKMAVLPAQRRTLVQTENVETGILRWWSYVYGDHGYGLEGNCIVPDNAFLIQDQDATAAVFYIHGEHGGIEFQAVDPIHGFRGLFPEK
jgi:hypothetical protein